MSDAYVIELRGNTVGIIVRERGDSEGYKFIAALHGFDSLEGREFRGPLDAESAVRKLWRKQPHAIPRKVSRNA